MANHLRANLVIDALEAAVGQRKPGSVVHHSGQGSQYTSLAFGKRCGGAGVRPSMGSVGNASDNAMYESFNASCWIAAGSRQGGSSLGYRSPMAYEAAMETATAEP